MKLRPCPFCGSTNTKLDANLPLHELEEFMVRCMNCGISGQWSAKAEEAIEFWNTRVDAEESK